jgi:hypothetical protein
VSDRPLIGELLKAWIHLAVLWCLAFAQPLFGVLSDSPEFFVARGNTSGDIALLALGLVLVPPTLLVAVEALIWRLPAVRWIVHLVFVGALVAAFAIQAFKDVRSGPGILLTALAIAVGVAAALAYQRFEPARSVLTVLAPAPVVFLVLFLFASPVSDLLGSEDDVPVRSDVGATAPVVVLVFDEFSVELLMDGRGRIDAERFPNFAELAGSATWFRNATTVSDHTTDAVPAVLTGRYPTEDALPTADDHPRNLFTLLGGAYSLRNVNEPVTDLCPGAMCAASRPPTWDRLESLAKDLTIVSLHRVLPNRLAERLPAVNQGFGNFADQGRDDPTAAAEDPIPALSFQDRPGQFERFVEGIDGDNPQALSFLHVLLPHTPWQYLPSGKRYPAPPGPEVPGVDGGGTWTSDPALPLQALQRTILQAGYVDRLVGRLLARLRAEGLFDRSLLIMTADHGISFRPGASRRGGAGPGAADVLGVPLFVKAPGQRRGRVDDRAATTADVLPTVADGIGATLRWRTDGTSLLEPPRARRATVSVSLFPDQRRVSMPFERFVQMRDEAARGLRALQGTRQGWAGVYAIGADSDLVGEEVASLPSEAASGAGVALDDADAYRALDPGAVEVPAFVGGRLTGAPAASGRVAVAIDGVVRAVAPTYDSDDGLRFGTLVPDSAFHAREHDVRVYFIAGAGDSRRLTPASAG